MGLIALLLLLAAGAWAKDRKPAAVPQAVIAGTVFRPPGFALGDCEITVTLESELPKPNQFSKVKLVSNPRGEFAVRVPAVTANYRVDVKKAGFQPHSKTVTITGQERYDLSIVLEPSPSNR